MKNLIPWLIVLIMLTVAFGTLYVVVQQAQRSDANYPQTQIAGDTAAALDSGDVPGILVHGKVDIARSLAPFTVIYDKKGKPVAGNGFLDGKLPKVDTGILSNSKGKDYNAVTWEPKPGVRIAAVTVDAKNYYVLSGRSLKEVEKNEGTTFVLSLVGWVISVLLLAGLFYINTRSSEEY